MANERRQVDGKAISRLHEFARRQCQNQILEEHSYATMLK